MKRETLQQGIRLTNRIKEMESHLAEIDKVLSNCKRDGNYEIFLSNERDCRSANRLNISNQEIKTYMSFYVIKFQTDIDAVIKELEDLKDE